MIANIKGNVSKVAKNYIILMSGNIGYQIYTSEQFKIDEQEIMMHTHLLIKEEQITIFGFTSDEKLLFFKELIKISGVGPKIALIVLQHEPHIILEAAKNNDIDVFLSMDGIGTKIARLLIFELQNKQIINEDENQIFNQLQILLNELGYTNNQILKIGPLIIFDSDIQKMLKQALELLKND